MMNNRTNAVSRRWMLCGAVILVAGACVELEIENTMAPDLKRAVSTPGDIEALISGAFIDWEWAVTHRDPSNAMSGAADELSSSWGNWGMMDASQEPRKAFNNDPSYAYSAVNEVPWIGAYGALASTALGLRSLKERDAEVVRALGQANRDRLVAFGKLIQALSLSTVAVIFDRGLIVDEGTDLSEVELKDYNEVWEAANAKFDTVIQLSQGGTWQIPSLWVGCNGAWSSARMEEIARSHRARYASQMARTETERGALDWAAIKADATRGITTPHGGAYDACIWGWHGSKWPFQLLPGWGRADIRTIGPADASGGWEEWINAPIADRRPFNIDTDDRRVTDGVFNEDGKYFEYHGNSPFRPERGLYHYSHYRDYRFDYIYDNQFVAFWPDMIVAEMDFLVAEANYRMGDRAGAMAIVNRYRETSGELPPFTDVGGVAPGGSRCVPQNADGSCGDLWEALKYEKRMEVFGYYMGSGYFDDRGWGDLVQWTWTQLPIPGSELEIMQIPIYTFGGEGGNSSAYIGGGLKDIGIGSGRVTAETLRVQRKLFEAAREVRLLRRPIDDVPINR